MAVLALVLTFAWIILVSAIPAYAQIRRGGEIVRLSADRRGSAQWWARRISTLGFVFVVAAPLGELAGLAPIRPLDHVALRAVGVVLVVVGTVVALVSQRAMGASWRADVDPAMRTDLVTTGPFRFVRNPILTGAAITEVGLALMVPNVIAAAMLLTILVALEIQVRFVEEPYLLRTHGETYRHYAERTGRFLPGVGRLGPEARAARAQD